MEDGSFLMEQICWLQLVLGALPNYVEGHYFRGVAVGIEVTVAYADEQGLQDYRFWVLLEPEPPGIQDGHYLHEHAHTLAHLFSQHGWRCFVPDDFTTVSGDHEGKIYAA